MALSGTIKDFGLADIFQLIGIQRKTGILTLDNGSEVVTVKFLEGKVVGADTAALSVEDLLGAVLVRTGRITEAQLQEALRVQKSTLQRLGYVLVSKHYISESDLVEALRVQSLQIVYRLFRWRNGSYHFDTTDRLEYDEKHFVPISAETILMEGARMIDEWPIIERRVKSDKMILRRTAEADKLDLKVETIVESDLDFDLDFGEGGTTATAVAAPSDVAAGARGIKLSSEEREILAMVDGKRTVEEINDRSSLGEFDTFRILCELMTRQLVEEVKRPTPGDAAVRPKAGSGKLLQALLVVAVFGGVAAGLATLHANPLSPWRLASRDGATEQLRLFASQLRLERIEEALEVFYLDAGVFPTQLSLLVQNGYLAAGDLRDPWGRPYGYALSPGGYEIFGLGPGGQPDAELTLSHEFTAVQRLMLEPAEPGAP